MHRVRYGCQPGYQIVGPEERKCSGGVWMPSHAPKCIKKPYQGEYNPSFFVSLKSLKKKDRTLKNNRNLNNLMIGVAVISF